MTVVKGTQMQEIKVETHEELDRLVAEAIGEKLEIGQPVPSYSTSLDLALKALDKFKYWKITKEPGGYRVNFYEMVETNLGKVATERTGDKSKILPLAICYAILTTKGLMAV